MNCLAPLWLNEGALNFHSLKGETHKVLLRRVSNPTTMKKWMVSILGVNGNNGGVILSLMHMTEGSWRVPKGGWGGGSFLSILKG
jgi:predicted DNA-binding ArsR family transcriptional regulator